MKFIYQVLILILIIALPVRAEVYKCKQPSGKIGYQTSPCPAGVAVQDVVKVEEMSPEEREDAKTRLKIWQEEQAVNESAKQAADKERQEALQRQEALELQRRSVAAQEQQAINQQQQNQTGVGFAPHYSPNWHPDRRYPYPPNVPGRYPYPPSRDPHMPPHHPWPPKSPGNPPDPLAPIPVPANPGKFGME